MSKTVLFIEVLFFNGIIACNSIKIIMHKRLSEGDKHEQKEAVADFISDEYFDNWYEETLTKLQAYEDGQ